MLCEAELESGTKERRIGAGWAVGRGMSVVKPNQDVGSPLEALVVGKIRDASVLVCNGDGGEHAARLSETAIHLQRTGNDRIKAGDRCAHAQRAGDQSTHSDARAGGSDAGAAG